MMRAALVVLCLLPHRRSGVRRVRVSVVVGERDLQPYRYPRPA